MHYHLDRMLKKLEQDGNNDLLQVHTLGPQFYSTPELYDLLEELNRQRRMVSAKLTRVYRIGAIIPVLVLATFMASYYQALPLALACVAGIPVIGLVFTFRTLRLRREYPTFFESQTIEYKIRQEIKRRQEESSVF